MRLTLYLFVALFALPGAAQSLQNVDILNRVYATYRTARSYQDVGTVTTTFTNRPNKKQQNSLRQTVVNYFYKSYTSTLQFQTAYERATGRFQ
jgi:hypothetical protein